MKMRREFIQGVMSAGLTGGLLTLGLLWVGGALLWPRRADAAVVLDPTNPNFTQDGTQSAIPGSVLTLTDTSVSDFVAFFAADADAYAGTEVDVVATFQVLTTTAVNADVGNRVVINDGQTRSAIAACIIQNGVRGIGLLSQGAASDPASYPFFVPVDWQAAPVTLRLRRTATGDAELVEVNGVAPSPRALLTFDRVPGATLTSAPTFEFGAASVEAQCTVAYSAFRSERVISTPVKRTTWGQIKAHTR